MKKLRLVLKSSITYIIIIILVVMIISALLSKISNEFKDDIIDHNIAVLSNIRDVADFELESINNMSKQFSVNPNIKSALNASSSDEIYDNIYDLWNTLSSINYLKQSILIDYYIYLYQTDIVIKSDAGFSGIESFYLKFEESDRVFLETIENDLHFKHMLSPVKYYFENKYIDVIPYLQSMPYDSLYNTKGIITYLLDKEKIDSFFSTLRLGKKGWAGILKENGEIITIFNNENPWEIQEFIYSIKDEFNTVGTFIKSFDDGSILMGVSSDKNDLLYLSYTEESVMFDKINQINSLVLLYALILLAAGIILIIVSTYIQFKPIIDSIDMYPNEYDNKSSNIFSIIGYVIRNNDALQHQVDTQSQIIKDNVINRILMGYYNEKIDIERLALDVNINIYFNYYTVIIIDYSDLLNKTHLKSIMEISSLIILVKKYMSKINNISCLYSEYYQNSLTMLLLSNEAADMISKQMDQLFDFLNDRVNSRIVLVIGKTYDSVLDIHKSYDEANETLMKHKIVGPKNQSMILWKISSPERESYSFSLQQQLLLYNTVLSGKSKAVKRILLDLEKNNLININLNSNMLIQLLNDLRSLVIKINNQFKDHSNLDNLFEEILSSEVNDKLFFMCEKYCVSVSEYIEKSKNKDKSILHEEIREYIEEHFTDYDMGVSKLADHFNMKESLFSQVFKKMFKENASGYIEKLRIEEACRLMKEEDLTIDSISEKIGYSYPQVFRRAFKRYYGKSPREYLIRIKDSN